MPVARFLVDTSALIRYPCPDVAARLDELSAAGVLASCGMVELQLLGVVRDSGMYARMAAVWRTAFEVLEMAEADFLRASQVQALLVERGLFDIAWPALAIAAVAERHGVTVLHYNPDFDLIAKVTGLEAKWVAAAALLPV
jgi:predicted nucleic acid-binding protein